MFISSDHCEAINSGQLKSVDSINHNCTCR